MKFRRGGRLAASDEFHIGGNKISFVNRFTYLGVVIPNNVTSFGDHVKNRAEKAIAAMSSIEKPWLLSLRTALLLFDSKVFPVATYGYKLSGVTGV